VSACSVTSCICDFTFECDLLFFFCILFQMLKAPGAVSSCANDADATTCLTDISLSASDDYKSNVNVGTNEEAGSPCVIEICPQVPAVLCICSFVAGLDLQSF